MRLRDRGWIRYIVASVALASVFIGVAGAETIPVGSRDGALLGFSDAANETTVYLSIQEWGTQYYDGVPPQNNSGPGVSVTCLTIAYRDLFFGGNCVDSEGHVTIEPLVSIAVSDTIPIDLHDGDDEYLRTELFSVDVTFTGNGAPFPGVAARTDPSPGAEFRFSFLRDATVTGGIGSVSVPVIDLSPAGAVIGHTECVAILAGPDDTETCRF